MLVSHDYHRFQENLAASTNLEKAKAGANMIAVERGSPSAPLPVVLTEEESEAFDYPAEVQHLWIQELTL